MLCILQWHLPLQTYQTLSHYIMYSHFSFIVNDRSGDARTIHFHGYFSHAEDSWSANARVSKNGEFQEKSESVRQCDTIRLPEWPFKMHLEDIRAHFCSNLTGLIDIEKNRSIEITGEEFLFKEMFRGPLLNPDFEYIAKRFERVRIETVIDEREFESLARNPWQVKRAVKALDRYSYKKFGTPMPNRYTK